ncbi:hypothetical protein M0804_015034 [Polistes exclamans]|nr:hypothetical protein M0804_015034 [Polistes exclamans]
MVATGNEYVCKYYIEYDLHDLQFYKSYYPIENCHLSEIKLICLQRIYVLLLVEKISVRTGPERKARQCKEILSELKKINYDSFFNIINGPSKLNIGERTGYNTIVPNAKDAEVAKNVDDPKIALTNSQLNEIFDTIETNKEIIAVSELWLSSCVVDDQIWLPMFHLYRHNRKRRHGGGVSLFVRNSLSSRIVVCSSNQTDGFPEYMIAEVRSSIRNKVLISMICRQPNTALMDIFE